MRLLIHGEAALKMPGKGALMEGVKDGRCGTKTAEHGSCGNIFAKCPARQRMRSREVPRLGRKRKLLSELTAAVQEKASDFHSGAPDDVQATPRVRCRPPESSCAPMLGTHVSRHSFVNTAKIVNSSKFRELVVRCVKQNIWWKVYFL